MLAAMFCDGRFMVADQRAVVKLNRCTLDPFVAFLCPGLIEHRIFGCSDHGRGLLSFLPGEGEISMENVGSEVLQEQFIAFFLGFPGELLCQIANHPV